jgi:hypothetical protein
MCDQEFWVVVIYPRGFVDGKGRTHEGKNPFGSAWGAERRTHAELDRQIDHFASQGFVPGLGICLGPGRGPDGRWLADLEGDGPEADASLSTLLEGEIIEGRSWPSARGWHHLILLDPARMPELMARLKKCEGKGSSGVGVYHIASLPDLELRIGGTHPDGTPKQIQSVCPPTPTTVGSLRVWTGPETIPEAPEAFYRTLGRIAAELAKPAPASDAGFESMKVPTGDRVERYLRGKLERASGRVAMAAEGQRHNSLRDETRALAGYLHYVRGFTEDELVRAMVTAGERAEPGNSAGISRTVADAIAHGKDSPLRLPDELHDLAMGGRASGKTSNGGNAPRHAAPDLDDDSDPIQSRRWPAPPDESVYRGLAGEFVRTIEPQTEADPLALMSQFLVMFGSAAGRTPYFMIEATRHHLNQNVVLVGQTSLGRKGTSADRVKEPFLTVEPGWAKDRIKAGLSSGEGLISAVRDPVYAKLPVKEKGRVVDYQDVMVDEGIADKRLLVLETEFGGALRALEREGNKLSALMRQAWDNGQLATLTKSPFKATDAHVSVIGHITSDELLALLSNIDAVNGFANRFLWFAVKRSKILPFGGSLVDLAPLAARLADALEFARQTDGMRFTAESRGLWEWHYNRLTTPPPGVLGSVTSRAAPHVVRLAMMYALQDLSVSIAADHLTAALALWDASARCAAYIFGESIGNGGADKILAALRAAAPGGLTRTQIREDVFQRNLPSARIKSALELLLRYHLIREERDDATGGAPAWRYYAINAINAKSPPSDAPDAVEPPPYRVNGVNGVTPPSERIEGGPAREVIEL